MALRHIDLRPMQAGLAPWGLASLGRCESRVMPTLNAIIANLQLISYANAEPARPIREDFLYGEEALHRHCEAVLGPPPTGHSSALSAIGLRARSGSHTGIAPWTLHDARRSVATHLAVLGTSPHVVEALLNHTPRGVQKIYNRATYEAEKRAALGALG